MKAIKHIIKLIFGLLLILSIELTATAQTNITKPNFNGPFGLSVNTYSGGLYYSRQDLFIPGRGLNIDFTFSYNNSRKDKNLGYGYGWTGNYSICYQKFDDGDIEILKADGRKNRYDANGDGSFDKPTGIFEELEEYESSKYVLRMTNGMQYFFDNPNHKCITKMRDRYGNELNFSYTNNLLSVITDDAGRNVRLTYTDGLLTAVEFNTVNLIRKYQYYYDDQHRLIGIEKPEGVEISYEYSDINRLIALFDEEGNPINIIYNNNGTVKKMATCLNATSFTYNQAQFATYVVEQVSGENQLTTYQYNEFGKLISQTGNCCGYEKTFEYDENNNIIKSTDANGNSYFYTYDDKGNVLTETDPLNQVKKYTYEPKYSLMLSETDKKGFTTNYTYDDNGNITQINYPENITKLYTYDNYGQSLTYTNGNGNVYSYAYDNRGYLIETINPDSSSVLKSYDDMGNAISNTDENGNETKFGYDGLERIINIFNAIGDTVSMTYNNSYSLESINDQNGSITLLEYDALDRLIKVTDPLSGVIENEVDRKGNVIKRTDANGNTITNKYDKLNRIIKTSNALNETFYYQYDANGNLESVFTPGQNTITYEYDALDRLINQFDDLGAISTMQYDANNNLIRQTDGVGNATTFQYDDVNRLTTLTDALGNSRQYMYDKEDNILQQIDRNGNPTAYTYDNRERNVEMINALNHATESLFDAVNNLIAITDANGNTTNYEYDALNRQEKNIYADNTNNEYKFDGVGNTLSQKDNNGDITKYEYDNKHRHIKTIYADKREETFTYDAGDRMLTANNSSAEVSFTYDKVNRLLSETLNGKITTYAYDVPNRIKSIGYPGERTILENSDKRGRLNRIDDTAITYAAMATYEFDLANRRTKRSFPINNTFTNYTYDNNSRLQNIAHQPNNFAGFNYGFDKVGNRLYKTNIAENEQSNQYQYDAIYRLTNAKTGELNNGTINNPNNTEIYNYDDVGNRSNYTNMSNTTNYVANSMNDYTNISGLSELKPNYDLNGNLLNDQNHTYQYDKDNLLLSVDNGNTAFYKYDALRRRTQKITANDTISFYYAGINLIEERNRNDESDATYVHGLYQDELINMNRNSKVYFYHQDVLGSIYEITDDNGNIVEAYQYDAYGNPQIFDETGTNLLSSTIENDFLYTGRRYDAESGLKYYRNRYYSCLSGRFIQRDPIGYVDGMALAAYVLNNPINYVDPNGLYIKAVLNCGKFVLLYLRILPEKNSPVEFPGYDPTKPPDGFEWRGKPDSKPGSKDGNYYNPKTGESFRPDLNHDPPIGPHWDYRDPSGAWWRVFPNGDIIPK